MKQNFVYRMVFKDIYRRISFLPMFNVIFTKHFYSETFIVF